MCTWHVFCIDSKAHILHVKDIFAIKGKTCQHLDSVAMKDLWRSRQRADGQICTLVLHVTLTERVVTKDKIKKVFTLKSYELEGRYLACWLQSSCSWERSDTQLQEHCDTQLLRLTDNPWVFDGFNFKAAGGGF